MVLLRDAKPADFFELARLRHRLLQYDNISKMGMTFLRYYYFPLFFYSKEGILIVSKNEREEITGYVAGSLNFDRQSRYVNFKIAFGLLLCFISRPQWIIETIRLKKNKSTSITNLAGYGKLSSLVVRENYQGRGIGEKLTTAFLRRLSEANIQRCYLNCRTDNVSALRLYTKIGFQESKRFQSSNFLYTVLIAKTDINQVKKQTFVSDPEKGPTNGFS